MVKQTIRIGLVSLLAVAMLLGVIPLVHADSSDNAKPVAVVDITITDDLRVDIAASGACQVNVKREGSSEANAEGMSPTGTTVYSHASYNGDPDAVVDITIMDELRVDIAASGACQVNVGVEGPWEVHIKAGDKVELNVEASDESQVFIDDQSLDNPAQKPDEPAGYQETGHNDPPATYQESQDVDEHSSRLDHLPIISGVFPAAGLFAFFLIRRRAKNKVNNEEVTK